MPEEIVLRFSQSDIVFWSVCLSYFGVAFWLRSKAYGWFSENRVDDCLCRLGIFAAAPLSAFTLLVIVPLCCLLGGSTESRPFPR